MRDSVPGKHCSEVSHSPIESYCKMGVEASSATHTRNITAHEGRPRGQCDFYNNAIIVKFARLYGITHDHARFFSSVCIVL